jgi:hypothetical protein
MKDVSLHRKGTEFDPEMIVAGHANVGQFSCGGDASTTVINDPE